MEDREVIELKFEAEDYWGLSCMCCDARHAPVGGRGIDELGHSFFVCERCLEEPEQIDAKLEQQAVELEKHAADFVKGAVELRNLKGRIKAPSAKWWAGKRAYEAERAELAEEEAVAAAELERLEGGGLPTEPYDEAA
jgi:hypothetical protein